MPPPLPLMHRIAGRTVLVMGDEAMAEPKRRFAERSGAVVVTDLQRAVAAGARLAFLAYPGQAEAAAAARRVSEAGLLVNVVDRPELCDFTTPAVIDRDPVIVAIGTGGVSAGLAKHLRLRLEALLPATLGSLAKALEGARAGLRRRFPDPATRRRALDAALEEGGPLDPFDPLADTKVAAWIQGAAVPSAPGPVAIQLLSSDPEELTLRQARLLGRADVLFHEAGVPAAILARARADAERRGWSEVPADGSWPAGLVLLLRAPRSTGD